MSEGHCEHDSSSRSFWLVFPCGKWPEWFPDRPSSPLCFHVASNSSLSSNFIQAKNGHSGHQHLMIRFWIAVPSGESSKRHTPASHGVIDTTIELCEDYKELRSGHDFILFITDPFALPVESTKALVPSVKQRCLGAFWHLKFRNQDPNQCSCFSYIVYIWPS